MQNQNLSFIKQFMLFNLAKVNKEISPIEIVQLKWWSKIFESFVPLPLYPNWNIQEDEFISKFP